MNTLDSSEYKLQNTPEGTNSKKFWSNRTANEDSYPTPTSPPILLPENEVVPKSLAFAKRKMRLDPISENPSSSLPSNLKSQHSGTHLASANNKTSYINNETNINDYDPFFEEQKSPTQQQTTSSKPKKSSSMYSLKKKSSENLFQQQKQQQQQLVEEQEKGQQPQIGGSPLPPTTDPSILGSSPIFKNPHLLPFLQARQKMSQTNLNTNNPNGENTQQQPQQNNPKPQPISIVQLESKFAQEQPISSPSSSVNSSSSNLNSSTMSRSAHNLKSKIPVPQQNYQFAQNSKAISSLSALRKQVKLTEDEFNFIIKQFKDKSKGKIGLNKQEFTSLIEQVLKERFNPVMLPAFYRIYDIFDSDGNGEIDFVELATGISALLHGPKHNTVKLLYSLIDKNGDGEVQKEELLEFFMKFFSGQAKLNGYRLTKERWRMQKEYLLRTFEAADLDKNGIIDFNEFLLSISDPDHPLGYVFMNLEQA